MAADNVSSRRPPSQRMVDLYANPSGGQHAVVCSSLLKHEDSAVSHFSMSPLSMRNTKGGWPRSTDVHCWHCCHQFEGQSLGIPRRVNPVSQEYKLEGNFCSFRCALAYLQDQPSFSRSLRKLYLMELAEKVYNLNTQLLRPAPPRTALAAFGGTLSIEAFHKNTERHRVIEHVGTGVSYKMIRHAFEHREQRVASEDVDSGHPKDGRWSVIGLRCPNVKRGAAVQATPTGEGMYAEFLKTKGVTSTQPPVDDQGPPAKRARAKKAVPPPALSASVVVSEQVEEHSIRRSPRKRPRSDTQRSRNTLAGFISSKGGRR